MFKNFITYLNSTKAYRSKELFALFRNVVPFPFEEMDDSVVARSKMWVIVSNFTRCQREQCQQ